MYETYSSFICQIYQPYIPNIREMYNTYTQCICHMHEHLYDLYMNNVCEKYETYASFICYTYIFMTPTVYGKYPENI